ncbi:MAG: hypothetical protein IKN42_05460, partial [Elusimicrobia bacterium]|nr:hypothetical protein [Elusimicrobiota bacterium]
NNNNLKEEEKAQQIEALNQELDLSYRYSITLNLLDFANAHPASSTEYFKYVGNLSNSQTVRDYRTFLQERLSAQINSDIRLSETLSRQNRKDLYSSLSTRISQMGVTDLLAVDMSDLQSTLYRNVNFIDQRTIVAFRSSTIELLIQSLVDISLDENATKEARQDKEREIRDEIRNITNDLYSNRSTQEQKEKAQQDLEKLINDRLQNSKDNQLLQQNFNLINLANRLLLSTNDRQQYREISKEMRKILEKRLRDNLDLQKKELMDANIGLFNKIRILNIINRNKNQINNKSTEELLSQLFNMGQIKLDAQASKAALEQIKQQRTDLENKAKRTEEEQVALDNLNRLLGKNGILEKLESKEYGIDLERTQDLNIEAKELIFKMFESFANSYWKNFDKAITDFVQANEKAIEKETGEFVREKAEKGEKAKETEKLRIFINNDNGIARAQQLKESMIRAAFGNNKTEADLNFVERLALDLKMSEMAYDSLSLNKNENNKWEITYGVSDEQNAYKIGTKDTRKGNEKEKRSLSNFGLGILGANVIAGTNTTNQVLMMCENLLGRVSALSAGGGKSHVYAWTCDQYFSLNENQLNIAEILGAKSTDADQLSAKGKNVKAEDDMKFIWKMMGIEAVNGEAKYKEGSAKNNYEDLEKAYTADLEEGYKGRVVTYSLGQRGFVELQARVGSNGKTLDAALNNVTLRVADEADVAALSRTAFILGTGDEKVHEQDAKVIIENLQRLQQIKVNIEGKEVKIKANVSVKTKEKLGDNEFTIINGAIICSDKLRDAILKEFGAKADLKSMDNASQISNIMRAMYVMQAKEMNIEAVAFIDGQPVSVESGSQQNNTTDQSSSYNVALVALQIQNLMRADNISEKDINNMKFEDFNYKGYDVKNVKMSVSSGESTISQIFSRNQINTLNCGGSATLDVAREVAQTIFGGIAVDIEASSIKKVIGQYNKQGEAKRFVVDRNNTTRKQITDIGIETAVEFLRNAANRKNGNSEDKLGLKKDKGGSYVGLLFGAMDMSYNAEVMIKALAQLSNGAFTYEQIVEATKGQTLTQVLEYIANNYSGLKQYTEQIQIIDADVAGNRSETVGDMAKTKGKLTFSNESGLRGVNFKSIDMVILDAHNFPSSELLQAIGRAGRNASDWGKDKASVTVYMEQASVASMLQEMQQADEYLQGQGRSLFKNTQETGNTRRLLNDIIRGNISDISLIDEIDLLETVSTYKSMQLKSESIMFKARQEAMYILAKETLAEMASRARNNGNMEDAKFLEQLYYQAIHNDESNMFGEDTTDGTMSDPMSQMRETFMQVLETAEVYIKQAQKHKFADASINLEFANRLVDIQNMRQEGAFQKLIDAQAGEENPYFESTFAQASREVNLDRGLSPSQDIAKTLIKLSSQLLPTKTNTQQATTVTAEQAINVIDNMTAEQRAKAEGYITTINTDTSLSYINSKGEIVLTEKGKVYAQLANRAVMPGKDWDKFIKWLFGVLGITEILGIDVDGLSFSALSDRQQAECLKIVVNGITDEKGKKIIFGLWDRNIRNAKAFGLLLDSYPNIDYNKLTIANLQQITNASYDSGLQQYALQNGYNLPPAQTTELAKLGLLLDGNYSEKVFADYKAVKAKFDEVREQQMIVSQNLADKNKATRGLFFEGIKNKIGLGVNRNLKSLNNIINPELGALIGKTPEEIKAAMALAGIEITADTDRVIANMMEVLNQVSSEVKEKMYKDLTLRDIPNFENMRSALDLAETDSADRFKNASYDTIKRMLKISDRRTGLSKLMDKARTMFNAQERQKEKLYSQMPGLRAQAQELEAETRAKEARAEFFDTDPYTEGEKLTLKDIDRYAYRSAVAVNSTETQIAEPTTEQTDAELLLVFAHLYPTQDPRALLKKYKSMMTRGEMAIAELLTEEEFGREGVYVKEDGTPSEEYIKVIKAKTYGQLMGITKIGNSATRDSLKKFGINYSDKEDKKDNISMNHGYMKAILKKQGLTEEQASALADTFTLEELSNKQFMLQLQQMMTKGLITITADTKKENIYEQVRGITPQRLRESELTNIQEVLKIVGLDIDSIRENNEKVFKWLSDSKILKELDGIIDFDMGVSAGITLADLSDGIKVKDIIEAESADEYIRREYMNKSYSEVLTEIGEKNMGRFATVMGIDRLEINRNRLEETVANAMADRRIRIKEHNEIVAGIVGGVTIEQLTNEDYINKVIEMIKKGIISAEEIMSGKSITDIILDKKEGDLREAFGEEYERNMRIFGLSDVIENRNELEEKYPGEISAMVISEKSVRELSNIEELLKDEKKMKGYEKAFVDGLTMKQVKDIARRQGKDIREVIETITDDSLIYAVYDTIKENLIKMGIEEEFIDSMTIKSVIESNIEEEVKGLKALGLKAGKIMEILKENKAKDSIKEGLRELTIAKMLEITKGMSKEQKDRLFKYVGIEGIDKVIERIKEKSGHT